MKKIILFFVSLCYCIGISSQILSPYLLRFECFDDQSYTKIYEDSIPVERKISNLKQWITKTYGDYKSVVQYEDIDNGRIVIKGVTPIGEVILLDNTLKYSTKYHSSIYYTLTIDCRPDKFRLNFENMTTDISYTKNTPLGETKSDTITMLLSEYMSKEDAFKDAFSKAFTTLLNSCYKSMIINDNF